MLTAQQMADTRRWLGWPTLKNGEPDYVYGHTPSSISLTSALTSMTATDEATLIATYLANLTTLEQAILDAQTNLDTNAAGPWTSNPREISQRKALFNGWRMDMAAFLGYPTGPGLTASSNSAQIVRA